MATNTKAQLQSASDDNIDDDVLILPSMHRAANDAIINELYPDTEDVVSDINSSTNNLTVSGSISGVTYTVKMWKQGRTAFVRGSLTVLSSASAQDLAAITNTDYTPFFDAFFLLSSPDVSATTAKYVRFDNDGKMKLNDNLTAGFYYFDGFYPVAN